MLLAPALATHDFEMRDEPVEVVRCVLNAADSDLDYLDAKLAFDRLIEPSLNERFVSAELDRLETSARQFAGPTPNALSNVSAIRKVIYEAGPWNGWRKFEYDHANVRGEDVRLKLLSNYLETRKGDCVSMPTLFLILAERLGLDVALAHAPNHIFLKLRLNDGRWLNLEPTSGGLSQRDVWLRHVHQMSDRSIESGMYLKTLSKREGVAALAVVVVQFLRDQGRFEETADVCDLIIAVNPRDGLTLVNLALVCEKMGAGLLEKYGSEFLIPLNERLNYWNLAARNNTAVARANALLGSYSSSRDIRGKDDGGRY